MRLILASASPRRAELLRQAGIEFEVIPSNADETVHAGETPERYVRRVAESKACAIVPQAGGRPVVAADTVVIVDDEILGKPIDREDARRMLRMLSGRGHQVITGVTVVSAGAIAPSLPASSGHARTDPAPAVRTRVESTTVEIARLTEDDVDWYLATGEPDDKAGAYAIQGFASRFITRISGSYSNVVGLPIRLVCEMLEAVGFRP